jgi:propanediol utilization protein
VRENHGLQIWLAFIGKPVRMSGQANKLIGCFDEILRSHGGVLAERHVVLAPDVEGRNANLAGGNVEIIVNGAIPIQYRGKGSWLGKPLRSLVN